MTGRIFNWGLLLAASALLLTGFQYSQAWFISGLVGLIPATTWLINDLRKHTMGSDVLAILSISGALFTDELLAAAVISLMLATGRVLESWAEGQAERELKSLLSRMPRVAHRVSSNGTIEEILLDQIEIGEKILVRSGEITATDGVLTGPATLDESALTGESLPISRNEGESISGGVVNAGAKVSTWNSHCQYLGAPLSTGSTFLGWWRLVDNW
jgi:cation transport ATPase